MARDKKKKSPAADRRRPIKKKTSILSSESIDWVDYKDVNLLRRFMSERAKIRARRVTGNSAQQQRAVARAIRIAREMALLPYSVRQVTQRSRGGRRDRGDRDRGDRDRIPEPPPDRGEPAAAADDGGARGPTEDGNGAEAPAEFAADAAAPAPASGEDQS
jgi:small subunit ribosomal protein S18